MPRTCRAPPRPGSLSGTVLRCAREIRVLPERDQHDNMGENDGTDRRKKPDDADDDREKRQGAEDARHALLVGYRPTTAGSCLMPP